MAERNKMKTLEQHISVWLVNLLKATAASVKQWSNARDRDLSFNTDPGINGLPELTVAENMGPSNGWVRNYVTSELNTELGEIVFNIWGEATITAEINEDPEAIVFKLSQKIANSLP